MKRIIFTFYKTLFSIIFILLLQLGSYAQLSGNYTINPKNSASSTNYQNWASAVGDLTSGTRTDGGTANGAGVTGPVVFTAYDTVYTSTQITLTAITGASSTNTITFKSTSDSSKCVLQYPSGTASTDDWVVLLDGADFITFYKIGLQRTGTNEYYTVVQLTNDADRNSFKNCWMKARKYPCTVTLGFGRGIGCQFWFSGNADSTLIDRCKMIYGYSGMYTTTASTGITISNNIFDTLGCSGLYMTSTTGLKVIGNTFSMGDFGTGQGHYVSYAIRTQSCPGAIISKNKIFMLAVNCGTVRTVVVANASSAAAPTLINNNFFVITGGTNAVTGISLYGNDYVEICYNNLYITSTLTTGSVIHENTLNTHVRIKNNNIVHKGGGMCYDLNYADNTGLDTLDYNNFLTNGTIFAKWSGVTYNSFSAFKTAASRDANSLYGDPGYVSPSNLHTSNIAIYRKATPYWRVLDDIDGEVRDVTNPVIGADEFFPAQNDAGITTIDSPLVFCSGSKNVRVSFNNYGYDTLKSVNIHWSLNGSAQTTYNWTGAIAPGGSSNSISLGSFAFSGNTAYNFKIWTASPNTSSDGNNTNDTLALTRYAGMSGNYTIGDTNISNYITFNQAITAMSDRGICGPITFNVYNGTYNEQLTLVQLTGMGTANPITFQSISGDSSKVIIRLPSSVSTGNNNAVIQLNGGDYLSFKKLTFLRTGNSSISEVLHILNGSDHNTFSNCQMINTIQTSANATGINIWSDQGTDNYNTFKNNYVKFGTYNMFYQGMSTSYEYGTVIEGNVFDSAYSSAVQLGYQLDAVAKGNIFRNSISRVTNNYDLQMLECDSATRVIGNYFYNANTDIAIHLLGCDAPNSTNPGIVANNFIAKGSVTGILLDGVNNQNAVFNSINFTGTSSSNAGIATSGTSSGIVLKNNNIMMAGGNLFYVTTNSHVSASDRNNLWSRSGQFAYWAGTTCNNIASLRTANSKDANSMSVDPFFTSSTNLHAKNTVLKGAGVPINDVTTDIDGQTRNTSAPDIGADEFALQTYDAGIIGLTSPTSPSCEGTLQVKATLKNWGSSALTSATINWSVAGVPQTPKSWTGNLSSLGTDEVLLGTYNFTGGTTPSVFVRSTSPNSFTDGFQYNDSFTITRQINAAPVANAGVDKDLCTGGSVQIGTAATGNTYKWMTMSGTIIGTTAQINVNPTSNTSYVLEVTAGGGCSDLDTVAVTIRSKPTPGFTINNNSQCLTGNSFVFSNTSSGASTYLWNFGDATTSTNSGPTHTYTAAGTYNVKQVAITTYGCKDSTISAVNVRPQPTTAFIANDTSQCLNTNSFVFTNNSSISSGTFTNNWSFGDNTTSSVSGPSKSYTAIGVYSVKLVTTSNYGCKDSISRNMYVRPNPSSAFVINDTSQCLKGNSFDFTDNSTISSGTTTAFWNFGDNTTSSATAPTKTYTTIGTYSVKLITTSNFGCKDSIIKQVMVNPHPITGFMTNNSSQCLNGNTFNFTNLSSGSSGYDWSFGDNTTSTASSPSKTYLTEGQFDVKLVTVSTYGCKDSTSKTVNVRPHPVTSFTISNDSQCVNANSFAFNNTTVISSGTFNDAWDFGDNTTSTVSSPITTYLNSGNYTVKLISTSDFGCMDSTSQMVYVHPKPVVSYIVAIDSQCLKGNMFNFDNTSSIATGTINVLWNFGDGNTTSTSDPVHTYLNAGIYTVSLYATSDQGCSDSLKGNVVVFPQPQAYFIIGDQGHCLKGNKFMFTDNTVITGDTISNWNWNFGDGNTDNMQNTSHSYSSVGDYDVMFIVTSSNGCIDSITKKLSVYPDIKAAFLVSDTVVCKNGNQIQFTNNSTGYTSTPSFNWDLGDATTRTDSMFNHTYATTGSFKVWMKITSAAGCSDSATKSILVKANPSVNLGADDTLVDAESKVLDAGTGFASYLWSNSAATSQITVDSTTFGQGVKTIWVRVEQNGCYGFDTVVILIKKSTSIDDPSTDIELKVYPNPVTTMLNVELSPIRKEMTLTLTDMNGKQLKSMRIMPANLPSIHQMDVSEFAKGVYYLNISNSETTKVTKIVKY